GRFGRAGRTARRISAPSPGKWGRAGTATRLSVKNELTSSMIAPETTATICSRRSRRPLGSTKTGFARVPREPPPRSGMDTQPSKPPEAPDAPARARRDAQRQPDVGEGIERDPAVQRAGPRPAGLAVPHADRFAAGRKAVGEIARKLERSDALEMPSSVDRVGDHVAFRHRREARLLSQRERNRDEKPGLGHTR